MLLLFPFCVRCVPDEYLPGHCSNVVKDIPRPFRARNRRSTLTFCPSPTALCTVKISKSRKYVAAQPQEEDLECCLCGKDEGEKKIAAVQNLRVMRLSQTI
jgi:hypothetical protein